MRRHALLALSGAIVVLGGCVYDPYTGTFVPCCSYYGYPYGYRPPYYYAPYGYPAGTYGAPPPAQPGSYPSAVPPPGTPHAADPARGGILAQRFAPARVTHDGRLTRERAATGMAHNFDAIDADRKSYVTLPEIRAFALERGARPVTTLE